MSTLAQTSTPAAPEAEDADAPLVSVVIPCLNEAENIERCVTAALEAIERHGRARARWSSPTTTPRTTPRAWPSRPARASWSSAGAATAAPTWRASRPRAGRYIVMADADLTYDFDEIPRFVAALRGRRGDGDRRPHGQHPAGRDAVAAPLHRQPDPDGPAQPVLPHRHQRRALRHARACAATCCRAWTCARPAWSSPRRW